MAERKVLNKYYPPDFDQSKLPKLKRGRNRQFVIRIMAPFSMRCTTCGEYIYKGRKFNSRMETVENENYLGLRIYRFYIRCTKCISEITFKTDPQSSDYVMEHGATRNFESQRRLAEKITREAKETEEEEIANPMKALENRTRDSKREMEAVEKLGELKDLNTRAAAIDPEKLIADHIRVGNKLIQDEVTQQEEEDEALVRQMFGAASSSGGDGYIRRILDDGSDSDGDATSSKGTPSYVGEKRKVTDLLVDEDGPSGSSSASFSTAEPSGFGPTPNPSSKKAKLKTPFDDLAAMVKVKKKKKESKKKAEKPAAEISIPKEEFNAQKKEDEPAPLPTYKINLKKQTDTSGLKMKGASLSLLGGYDTGSSSSNDDE